MNWYKKAIADYIGDCRSITVLGDATEMTQLIENGIEITTEEALSHLIIKQLPKSYSKGKSSFSFGRNENILWAYDELKDIHYFYELV